MRNLHLMMIVCMMTSSFVGDRMTVRATLFKTKRTAATAVDAVSGRYCRGVPRHKKPAGSRMAKSISV